MTGIKDLFASERGLFGLMLVIAATALTGMGQMTVPQWQEFATWVFGIYVSGKSLTGAVGLIKGSPTATSSSTTASEAPKPDASILPGSAKDA
jgi:hypothetical protein